jgi:hypothetical protein
MQREGDTLMPETSVAKSNLRLLTPPYIRQLQHSANAMLKLEKQLAATTQAVLGETPVSYPENFPQRQRSAIRFTSRFAVNALQPDMVKDGELRGREAVAQAVFQKDYPTLNSKQQQAINIAVAQAWLAMRTYLEGISEPVPASRRQALQPELAETEVAS